MASLILLSPCAPTAFFGPRDTAIPVHIRAMRFLLPDLLALRDQTSLLYSSTLSTWHRVWQIANAWWLVPKEWEEGTLSSSQLLNTACHWLSSASHSQLFFHGYIHVPLCGFHLQLGSLPWSTHVGPVPFLGCDHSWNSLVCLPVLLVSFPPL